jgi:hypothetical protein
VCLDLRKEGIKIFKTVAQALICVLPTIHEDKYQIKIELVIANLRCRTSLSEPRQSGTDGCQEGISTLGI